MGRTKQSQQNNNVLDGIDHQLQKLAREADRLNEHQYSADDVRRLQNKVHQIDEKYRQGCIDLKQQQEGVDPYEEPHQGRLADELNTVHTKLHDMLERLQ